MFGVKNMPKLGKLIFEIKERVSFNDATVFLTLVQMNGEKIFCEVNAHKFESGDLQLIVIPKQNISVIVQAGKP